MGIAPTAPVGTGRISPQSAVAQHHHRAGLGYRSPAEFEESNKIKKVA